MKINAVKIKIRKHYFYDNGRTKIFARHENGKFQAFVVEHRKIVTEFKIKYTKTKVDILGPFKRLEKFIASIK